MKFLATVGVIGALSAQTLAWNTQSSCPQYSSWDGSSCVCWNGYKREGSYCVTACPEGWELDYKTQSKCVRSCHQWNTYYDEYKDKCVSCPYNSIWEPSWQQCRCYSGYEWHDGHCVEPCKSGYIRKGYECVKDCPAYSVYEKEWDKCVCNDGYKMDSYGVCKPLCTKDHEIYDHSAYKCVCVSGFKRDSYDNCIPDCKEHEVYDHSAYKCVCQSGFKRDSYGNCIPDCGHHEVFDHSSYKCVCESGFQRDQDNKCVPKCGDYEVVDYGSYTCVCKDGFSRDSYNKCIPDCGHYEVFSHEKYQCVCQKGYSRDSYGACIKECQENASYDYSSKSCRCRDGYEDHYGTCEKIIHCPPNSSFESYSGKCVCWAGFKPSGDYCIPACPEGWELDYKTQSKCVRSCHEWNTYYDEYKDKCVSCPYNSLWEPSWQQCRCYSGYEWVHYECLPTCPSGTHREGYDCKDNEYDDSR